MNKPKIFFTADLHFGHQNVIKFDNRPFATLEEMHSVLIEKWNAKVGKGDIVYILGDMFWKSDGLAEEILPKLNGNKILIKGNHDKWLHNSNVKKLLGGIKDYECININVNGTDWQVEMSHYFMPFYKTHRYNGVMLHGHSHTTDEHYEELQIAKYLNDKGFTNKIVNVGCMFWNYEPITLEEILDKYNKGECI